MLTLEDLGVLREVRQQGRQVVVTITPTYSGCPAMATMRDDLVHRLTDAGYAARVEVALSPAWSSDWITERGRAALRAHGLSAPGPAPQPRRPDPADADAHGPGGDLPAVRVGAHRADLGVRRDRVQGALPLLGLPRAVRAREGDLMAVAVFHTAHGRRRRGAHRRRGRGDLRGPGRPGRRVRVRARSVAHPAPDGGRRRAAPAVLDQRTRRRPPESRRPRDPGRAVLAVAGPRRTRRRRDRGADAERPVLPRPGAARGRPAPVHRRRLRHHADAVGRLQRARRTTAT